MEQCAVCLRDLGSDSWPSAFSISGGLFCHDCIRELFERAIKHQDDYPPRIGDVTLCPKKYSIALPLDLRKQLREKEREYAVVPDDRIYCKECSAFIAPTTEVAATVQCVKCGWSHCSACKDRVFEYRRHVCIDKTEQDAFAGLIQGKDYQICPSAR